MLYLIGRPLRREGGAAIHMTAAGSVANKPRFAPHKPASSDAARSSLIKGKVVALTMVASRAQVRSLLFAAAMACCSAMSGIRRCMVAAMLALSQRCLQGRNPFNCQFTSATAMHSSKLETG